MADSGAWYDSMDSVVHKRLTLLCYTDHMNCVKCGNELSGRQTRFCSQSCKNNAGVVVKRQRNKEKYVEYLGGKCSRCEWNEHPAGLAFHHVNPADKSFQISTGVTRSWARVRVELDKCVLLCHNCHAVVHATNDPVWVR